MGNQIAEENLTTGEIITNELSSSGQLTQVSKTTDGEEAVVIQKNTWQFEAEMALS